MLISSMACWKAGSVLEEGVLDTGDLADELPGGLFDFVGRRVDSGRLSESFD